MEQGIHFDITGDSKALVKSLQEAQKAMETVIGQIEQGGRQVNSEMDKMGQGIENTFKRIAQAAAGVFAVSQAKQMVSQIIDVRKEFQSLELSFQTLMGSAAAGKKMFQDITQFAVSTPMLEKDLAKGAQTLLGFNIEAEKVMPILRQIGDISMADSQKFESLVLAFAQASSTGKLMGQDLLQMINAGFNPLVEISRTTGRSLNDLKDAMSKGEISVEMLQNAFKTATDEGGKFHGMLNGMAQGMQGAFSNLEGAIQKLFNDIGQEIEQPVVEGTNLATAAINGMMENLNLMGSIIASIASTYGVYKATCLAVTAAQAAQTAGIGALTTAEMAHKVQIVLTDKAHKMLNATMLANPYVAAATALAAVTAALITFANRASGAEQAQKALNDAVSEQEQKEEAKNAQVQKAISLATDESKASVERAKGVQALVAQYGPIIQKYIDEEGHLTNIIALKREIALLDGKKAASDLQGQSKQYAEYARVLELSLKGRASMSKADQGTLEKAMAQYSEKTGGGKYAYSRARQYYASLAKGTAKQAGTRATQANVDAFSEGIGSMTKKQLQAWKKRLDTAKELAKSGSKVNIQGISKGTTAEQIEAMLTQVSGTLNAKNEKSNTENKKIDTASKTGARTMETAAARQQKQLDEAAPKVEYVDKVLQSVNTYTVQQIAKEQDTTVKKLYAFLKEKKVLFRQSGTWMLTAKYNGKGYTKTRTYQYTRNDGTSGTKTYTVMTEAGRAFIHQLYNTQN